ncbi:MAG: HemK2/MTQ2 family protein methyltransferase [Candidatus Woesearchaeota archaeon]
MIYKPREDSFLLRKQVRKYAKGKVLDMGTGSGIQAMATSENTKDVLAVDINPKAVEKLKKKGVNAIESDLFANVKGKFDLIIFNPPYLPEDPEEDEESKMTTTGGKEGHEITERFLKEAKKHLKKNGIILLLFSSMTGDMDSILKKLKYNFRCIDKKKMFFEELYVYLVSLGTHTPLPV